MKGRAFTGEDLEKRIDWPFVCLSAYCACEWVAIGS